MKTDRLEFIALNANPNVMQFFPNWLNKQESIAFFKQLKQYSVI
ncbi:hypothetical protein [Acinetobacter sp. HY1485]|nr:hypothetical protein [Acinetobacter sp. HY1485]